MWRRDLLAEGCDGVHYQLPNPWVARNGEVRSVPDKNVGDNFGVYGVFQPNILGSHKHKSVRRVENGSKRDVTRNDVIGESDTIDLHSEFNGDFFVAKISSHAQHGPASRAVAYHDYARDNLQFSGGQLVWMRRKMSENPVSG